MKANAKWHALTAAWLGEMFDGMDASIFVLVMFPALSELLKTKSHAEVGMVGSVILATFMLGWAAGAIVFGVVADYIGRARTMMLTILMYAAFTGMCAFAHNWQELAIYRFLVGCGIGGEISVGAVVVAEAWKGRSRLHATGVLNSSFAVGYLTAAVLNLFLGGIGWRWLFLVGVIPAFVTVYVRTKLTDSVDVKEMSEERTQFSLMQIFSPQYVRKIIVVMALGSTAIIGYWAVLSWIPPWINQLTGTNAVAERSHAAIAMNIGAIASSLLSGWLIAKFGRRVCFIGSFTLAMAACIGMFMSTHAYGPMLLAWTTVVGFFAIIPFAILFVYVPELFPSSIRATAFGFCVQTGRLAAACAALASGHLIAAFGGSYAIAGSCVALCYLIGIVAAVAMPQTDGTVQTETIRRSGRPQGSPARA